MSVTVDKDGLVISIDWGEHKPHYLTEDEKSDNR